MTTIISVVPSEKVYGVEWAVSEEAYGIYDGWQATNKQLLDMVLPTASRGFLDVVADR